jgi:solute carrier family 30 (zinc transporter), member 2
MVEESKQTFLEIQSPTKNSRQRRLFNAIILCSFLFLIQLLGGYFTSSLALLSDAFHMLTDVIGYSISLVSIILALSPASTKLPFGRKRLEVLGALSSIFLLWVLTLGLVYEAFERLKNPKVIDGRNMFIMAVFGVVFNGILIFIFAGDHLEVKIDGESKDGDGRDEQVEGKDLEYGVGLGNGDISNEKLLSDNNHTLQTKSEEINDHPLQTHTKSDINIKAAMLHAIGDLLCSIGVLIASVIIWINPEMNWVDPFCTFLFGIMAIGTTLGILKDIYKILMQATPDGFDDKIVKSELMLIDGVVSVDLLQAWALTQTDLVGSCVLTVSISSPYQITLIIQDAKKVLELHGIGQSTVQTSPVLPKLQ